MIVFQQSTKMEKMKNIYEKSTNQVLNVSF